MTLEELASKIDKAQQCRIRGQLGYRGLCPAHDDKTASFAIWEGGDGWVHVNCKAGCSERQIENALGIGTKDRCTVPFDPDPTDKVVYAYVGVDGVTKFVKERLPGKKFIQKVPGSKSAGLSLIGDDKNLLYHLPEVLAAVANGETIYLNEGEKASDMLRSLGVCSTCQPMGAHGAWLQKYTDWLRGGHVVIVADRDEKGEQFARRVFSALEGSAASVRIVRSKTTDEKDDAFDHIKAGYGLDEFVPAPDLEADVLDIEGGIQFGEDFTPFVVNYLWEPYLYFGQSVLFVANSGVGKSSLLVAMSAGFSRGVLPNGDGLCEPGKTAYFIADSDPAEAYETIYRDNGGVPGSIYWIKHSVAKPLDERFKEDIRKLAKHGYKLIIVDPLQNYLAATCEDSNNANQAVKAFSVLASAAEELGVCLIAAHHTNKSGTGYKKQRDGSWALEFDPSEAVLGSAMLRARARGMLYAAKHPEDYHTKIVLDAKGSIVNPTGKPFAFKRRGNQIEYIAGFEYPLTSEKDDSPSKLAKCREWLQDALQGGWIENDHLTRMCKDEGFSEAVLVRARSQMVKDGLIHRTVSGKGDKRRYHWTVVPKEYDPYTDS